MTLVLATIVDRTVILAGDSRIQFGPPGGPYQRAIDRKLFKTQLVGIATYGGGPVGVRVPAVLDAELQHRWAVAEVIEFLQWHFHKALGMCALVGGFETAEGVAQLFDVQMRGGAPVLIGAGQIVVRGDVSLTVPHVTPSKTEDLIAQMLGLLKTYTNNTSVAPPYEFLMIEPTARM